MKPDRASRLPAQGQPVVAGIAGCLATLEAKGASARVQVFTDLGDGEVDLVDGKIVDAYFGAHFGRAALFSLLGLTETRLRVVEESMPSRPAIVDGIAELLADKARRMDEWKRLTMRAPSLSSIPAISPDRIQTLPTDGRGPQESVVLSLIDGKRTITEIIDQSGLDAVDALGVLVTSLETGLLVAPASKGSLFPVQAGPVEPSVGFAPAASPPSIPLGGKSLRRTTVIGMGTPIPTPIPEPVRPRRIISVAAAPLGSAEPVAPRRGLAEPVAPRRPTPLGIAAPAPLPEVEVEISVAGPHPATETTGPATADRDQRVARPQRYVGRYEVLCRIGHGGMGTVYLARITSEGGFRRLFALKLLRSHLLADAAAARNFLDEARLAGQIHHPNVVSVIDAGVHDSNPFLVMDYVEGTSLKDLLSSRSTTRAPNLILPIVLDALAGLHAAHTLVSDDGSPLQIVHCDVSPENLLVGVDGVCRLTDFGVAKHGAPTSTRGGQTHGKPGFLSPEQITGSRVDRRADIFSMGIVLYNSLTGTKLFDGANVEETMKQVGSRAIEPPSTVGNRPSPALDFLCMKALERDPARRFQTADEMALELRRVGIRENLLAPTAAIADWVKECAGPELSQRRLTVLDAARRPPSAPSDTGPAVGQPSAQPVATAPTDIRVPSEPPLSSPGEDRATHTIPLTPSTSKRFVVVAALLAAALVFATLLWPSKIAKLFKVKTEGFAAEDTQLKLDGGAFDVGTTPSAVGPALPTSQTQQSPLGRPTP